MASSGQVLVSGVVVAVHDRQHDRNCLWLVTDEGQRMVLRRAGDNPFVASSEARALVGQKVTLEGVAAGRDTFIYSELLGQEPVASEAMHAATKAVEARHLRLV